MYKYQAEALAAKWQKARKYQPSLFYLILLALITGMMVYNEINAVSIWLVALLVVEYLRYYYISPLLAKVEFLENEVARLKKAADIEDEPLY